MPLELTPEEARALGALVEKSLTTREQYPLTFNSLLNACNQKSSRDPVMTMGLDSLGVAVQALIQKGLVERQQAPGERVPKFRHDIGKLLGSDDAKVIGIMTVLLLRGPQTPGEIKNRTDRLCEFTGTAEVEGLMQGLCAAAEPFVARLPRQPGQKEARYQHLFCGAVPAAETQPPLAAPGAQPAQAAASKVALLEARVAALELTVKELQERLGPKPG
ncbi:MAG: YceH family protein [Elusimicrobiales bacterium]|nr:YceH family protein [Elusimicrobiales bacterium]